MPSHRRFSDRIGDELMFGLTALGSVIAVAVVALTIYEVVNSASPAMSHFGLGFLVHSSWVPTEKLYSGGALIFGTVEASLGALVIAAPLGIAIGLYLSLLSSRRTAAVIGPLVELLAAVPSVIIGLWGIIVLSPVMRANIEPALHDALGWIPLFGGPTNPSGSGMLTAIVILAIMALPIIAAITRDLFLTVPSELKDGALALGTTRWEMVRGVVLSSMRPGIASACILGASRALGEAIAVTQVIGDGYQGSPVSIAASLFPNADTIGSRIAELANDDYNRLLVPSLFYLATILLVIELAINLIAQLIVRHYRLPSSTDRRSATPAVDVSMAATAIDVEM
jgi:phosphate transport system permease protein